MLNLAAPSLPAATTAAVSKHCTAAAKAQFRYAAIIDAGSSGTRLFIYKWKYPFKKGTASAEDNLLNLELIFKGDTEETSGNDGKGGIHLQSAGTMKRYLHALIVKGATELRGCTDVPIYLLATGGMRGIGEQQRKDILIAAHDQMIFARRGGDTTKDEGGDDDDDIFYPGGPDTNALVITGEQEGLLGWTALNYGRSGDHSEPIVGLHEMGGASIQIAYPTTEEEGVTKKVCLVSGGYHVRSMTRDGFGADDINKERVRSLPGYGDAAFPYVSDPCLPKDRIVHISGSVQKLMGTGRIDLCLQWAATTLAGKAPAPPHANSLPKYNTIRADGTEYFLGIATYQYTYEFFGQLGTYGKERLYDPRLFDAAVKKYCMEKPWGELGVKYNKFTDAQCFKAAWVKTLLHNPTHGFGIPRGLDETWKGIFRFPMQVELDSRSTWTVGAAVLIAREGGLKLCEGDDQWEREDDDEEEDGVSRLRVPISYNTTLVLHQSIEAPGAAQIVAPSPAAAPDSGSDLFGYPIHLVAFSAALLLAASMLAYRRIRTARATPKISLPTDMKSVV